jgi:hypothetical protein
MVVVALEQDDAVHQPCDCQGHDCRVRQSNYIEVVVGKYFCIVIHGNVSDFDKTFMTIKQLVF